MMKMEDKKTDKVLRKKTYEIPKLIIYGDINKLTKALPVGRGKNDHGKPSYKTSL